MPKKKTKGDVQAGSENSKEILASGGKAGKRNKQRPDPLFKELLTEAATEANFKGKPNELQVQQASSTDLFLEIEEGTPKAGTIFDFFRQYNVVEFKSANDSLTIPKFQVQMARVGLWSNKHRKVALEQILNIIVSAKYPREFLKRCEERGCKFKEVSGREWLLEGLCGLQDIAIVVCERLPIEPKYAIWLIFADPTTDTWHKTIAMLARNQDWKLFEAAVELAPEEVEKMSAELDKIFEQYNYGPEHRAKVNRAKLAVIRSLLPSVLEENPEELELGENTRQLLNTLAKQGLEQGKREGERSGELKIVVRQLSRKLGQPISLEIEKQISELPAAQLTELGEALLDFTSLEDLTNWLSTNKQ